MLRYPYLFSIFYVLKGEKLSKEAKLLQRAKKLDKTALADIYDEYSPGIYRYAYRQLGDTRTAEDCVAETFERFLKAIGRGKGPREHLKAYLYRIAHNWITDHFRGQPPPIFTLEPEIQASEGSDPETSAIKKLEIENIRKMLRLLTPEQRQVIVLKYIEGWSNQEIADAIGKPVGATKALQHRGLASLRRVMKAENTEIR